LQGLLYPQKNRSHPARLFPIKKGRRLAIGTVTPPVALNLYVAALPFIFALIISLLIVTYIPSLSLWLPHLFGFH
jgi:hypothetical protein